MTAADWAGVLLAFICTLGLGSLTVAPFRFRGSWIQSWASRYLVGQLMVFLLVLTTAFCPWSIAEMQIVVVALLAVAWAVGSIRRRRLLGGRALAAGIMAVLVSAAAFPDVVLVTQKVPLWEWDARSIWFFHGKAIFLAGRIDSAFFANPLYAFTLPDYPLFIPAQAAWTAQFVGRWSDYSAKAFLIFNFASYVYLLWRVLERRETNRWLALLFIAVLFDQETYSYVSGLADNHYIIAAVILLIALGSRAWPEEAAFLALMLVFVAGVKNEGKIYAGFLLAAGAAWWTFQAAKNAWGRRPPEESTPDTPPAERYAETAKACLLAVLLGVVPIVMWQLFCGQHGIVNPVQIVQRLAHGAATSSSVTDRLPLVWSYVAEYCRFQRVDCVAGILLLLVLLRMSIRSRTHLPMLSLGKHEAIVWAALAVSGFAIVAAYLVTPLDCEFHLRTSAGRLLLLPRLLMYVLVFYAAEVLWSARTSTRAVRAGNEGPSRQQA